MILGVTVAYVTWCIDYGKKTHTKKSVMIKHIIWYKHTDELKDGASHTGPPFNTGTENTIQVSKFKRIGFEKNGGF